MNTGIGMGIGEGMKNFVSTYMATQKHYQDTALKKQSADQALEKLTMDKKKQDIDIKVKKLELEKLEYDTDPETVARKRTLLDSQIKSMNALADFRIKNVSDISNTLRKDTEDKRKELENLKIMLDAFSGGPGSDRSDQMITSIQNQMGELMFGPKPIRSVQGMPDASTDATMGKGKAENTVTNQYSLDQIIDGPDGKRYKIVGLDDPNDPDIEELNEEEE